MEEKGTTWESHILGQSDLPEDDFTWTDGSNYGLDGHHYTQTMGEGVKEHGTVPGATPGSSHGHFNSNGMSGLPEGFLSIGKKSLNINAESEEGMDLMSFLEENDIKNSSSSLSDFNWLDPTQNQDPDRLPKKNDTREELEEAWGVYRRTDGANLIPSKDLDAARYYQKIKSPPPATPGTDSRIEIKDAIMKASRRSHYGHNLKAIALELREVIPSLNFFKMAMEKITEDYGLAGNVFIRANSFPGLKNGKWIKELKRCAKDSRYIISDDPSLSSKLGMEVVREIPWEKALSEYLPRLKLFNYKISSGSPKEILRNAFLTGPKTAPNIPKEKPIEIHPVDKISIKEALDVFRNSSPEKQEVISSNELEKARERIFAKIRKLANKGLFTRKQAVDLLNQKESPHRILKMASEMLESGAKCHKYEGTPHTAFVSNPGRVTKTAEFIHLSNWLRKAMNEGSMGNELTQLITSRWSSPLIAEAEGTIRNLRESHEGLAGVEYVDSSAYASKTGYTGCKEGALKHRANPIKNLISMPRCSSCIHNNKDARDNSVCSVYNKLLVDEVGSPQERMAAQEENIRRANLEDSEAVSSLFTSPETSIVSEYNLTSSNDIELLNAPSTNKVSEILFGDGIEIED